MHKYGLRRRAVREHYSTDSNAHWNWYNTGRSAYQPHRIAATTTQYCYLITTTAITVTSISSKQEAQLAPEETGYSQYSSSCCSTDLQSHPRSSERV